jgi:hypothetical protein
MTILPEEESLHLVLKLELPSTLNTNAAGCVTVIPFIVLVKFVAFSFTCTRYVFARKLLKVCDPEKAAEAVV